jgi:peptide/nickel transport system permease protein
VVDHAVLPALTIVLASAAGWIVGMRNVMVTTMDEDYVLVAQAKGLPKRRVVSYAARNAILPSVTGFSLAIGFVVSGALLTEIVFSYPASATSCSRPSSSATTRCCKGCSSSSRSRC